MKELKQYYRDIAKNLPVGRKQKQQILLAITRSVEDYLAVHPLTDFPAVLEHFGSPQEIAASYIENMTTPEILKKFRIRRAVLIVICSGIVLALTLWVAALVSAWIDAQEAFGGFYDVGPITESIMEETK